jgi:signal transduction histidine kinase/iron only hydrogenase large subunit-like protein
MTGRGEIPLVSTLKELCRMCYSCVRECPAKAIRISGGQAEVIADRCIGCGNCVRVCSRNAKVVRGSKDRVFDLLKKESSVAALVAPSFPAEFPGVSYRKVVSMIRSLGFKYVCEVAFGADLVSAQYRRLLKEEAGGKSYIGTTCPAIVFYIEKYHPDLVDHLAPIASPMIATSRAIHKIYGDDISTVFIGPCLAKKDEALRDDLAGDVDEVLTFTELREMLLSSQINPDNLEPSEFDPPHPIKGTLYPIGGGLLQASDLPEDLLSTDIVSAIGHKQFIQAIKEYETLDHNTKLLELNCCEGCISGSGLSQNLPLYARRGYVSNYARKRVSLTDKTEYKKYIDELKDINLQVKFAKDDHRLPAPSQEELREILKKKGKLTPEDELNCGACGYDTCIEHAIAIHRGLAEYEMCLPYMVEQLKKVATELSESYKQLVEARQAMVQSEKLASLGRMASGIAHEINNPLTGVLTYSSLMKDELKGTEYEDDLRVIINETMRCRNIVKGLLDFARNTSVEKIAANINDVIRETVNILQKHVTYQNVRFHLDLDDSIPLIEFDVSLMRSVFNNLSENAAHAMPSGGDLFIKTSFDSSKNQVVIVFKDTGIGISEENITKIFDPFFTTKEAGKGTGLGLAVIYGIIERHNGTISVESKEGEGATFTITLPAFGKLKL